MISEIYSSTGADVKISIPLSNLMSTDGSNCYISISNTGSKNQILLGQAYLESFQINVNYTSDSV